jgi:hypothetical protein
MMRAALDQLIATQNGDGGWGARAGARSNTEVTALAVAALSAAGRHPGDASVARGIAWLASRQRDDGSWPLRDDLPDTCWATGVAVLALTVSDRHRDAAERGARWLLDHRGRAIGWLASIVYRTMPGKMSVRANPDLRGWSWASNTSSWVEPTAYGLVVLKKLRPALRGTGAAEQIDEAERLLADRMCEGGGWNYGNSTVLGVALPPYPDTTALALIALQDRRADPGARRSLDALGTMLEEVESGLSLGWAIVCFGLHGRPTDALRARLHRLYGATGFLGESRAVAVGLLASSTTAGVFQVAG